MAVAQAKTLKITQRPGPAMATEPELTGLDWSGPHKTGCSKHLTQRLMGCSYMDEKERAEIERAAEERGIRQGKMETNQAWLIKSVSAIFGFITAAIWFLFSFIEGKSQ